ncbi:hypothetical protein GCM10011367_12510 [Marinicauda pacifica]|uniref:Peptidase A2 domain-containing protein n=1 Tax=Marinicauda pacifica TaxID=1133559 RepID=A0A4S2HG42_9PROT|nr:aspartyl protease family protein [Marinicauda pacifica]TGY94873.1 hypothetical protein E5162_06325 [Marinicauda pacifica]GGE39532.1 hypothetical protein GCM10011367_12510 [Marinicauda pacifica]
MALFPVLSLLAAAVQAPAEAGQCVPLALTADYRPAVTVEIEGFGPARFLIDTGASNTALARSVVEALNAQDVTAREVITLTELFATGTVDVSLSVFPGEAREVEAVIVESDLEESSTILGLLGADFFSGDTIDMDFSRGALCITDALTAPRDGTRHELSRVLIANASLYHFNRPVRVLVDTGATRSVANSRLAELYASVRQSGWPVSLGGVASRIDRTDDYARLNQFEMGGTCVRRLLLPVADVYVFEAMGWQDEPAMIMGMDLLQFTDFVIDYDSGDFQITGRDALAC